MPSIIDLVSEELTVPPQLIESALHSAHTRFRKIRVPKRAGGHRTIVIPAAELKLVHYWLNARVFSLLPLSPAAAAFHPGASIVKNAAIHKKSRYSVRIDLSDFFPSIRCADLVRVILQASSSLPAWIGQADFVPLLRQACFDRDDRLPIGYPTSPSIANAVMVNLDNGLLQLIREHSGLFGRALMTRYADDFIFSTDKPHACETFVEAFSELILKTESPRLKINKPKTRYMSRLGGSMLVTGLRINQDGNVRVHANYRDHVRLLLKHFSNGSLRPGENQKLIGHLAYVEHADPMLFTRLSYRYFDEIARLRGG